VARRPADVVIDLRERLAPYDRSDDPPTEPGLDVRSERDPVEPAPRRLRPGTYRPRHMASSS
jgi:hypothetical protein